MKQQTGKAGRKPKRDEDLLNAGRQMANVMYNLKTSPAIDRHSQELFAELQGKWDAAVTKYRGSFKRKAVRP